MILLKDKKNRINNYFVHTVETQSTENLGFYVTTDVSIDQLHKTRDYCDTQLHTWPPTCDWWQQIDLQIKAIAVLKTPRGMLICEQAIRHSSPLGIPYQGAVGVIEGLGISFFSLMKLSLVYRAPLSHAPCQRSAQGYSAYEWIMGRALRNHRSNVYQRLWRFKIGDAKRNKLLA